MEDETVAALLAEREGYVRRGLKDRVAQVDAVLKSYKIEVATEGPQEAASAKRGRKS